MNQTIPYFILAFILSWSIYIPLALNAQGIISSVPGWLHIFGAYGPLLAAFILTAARDGKAGLRELTGRITRWRIGPYWLGIALSPAVIFIANRYGPETFSHRKKHTLP